MCALGVPKDDFEMADLTKGTDDSFEKIETDSSWFIISEAECRNDIDSFETIFEESTDGSLVSDIIDDVDDASQGNSLALFNRQIADDCNKAITDLKRKYLTSPQQCVAELSPRLEAVKISGEGKSKRRLFQDSGIEEDEIASTSQVLSEINNTVPAEADETLDLLKCNNRKATLLWKIKEVFAVSFSELTRLYKSDKTCSLCWVVAVCNVSEDLLNSSKILLQQHVDFVQIITVGRYALYLIEFKTGKSRETVSKMFCKLLNVKDYELLCQPPKLRSVAVALYFYKRSLSNVSFKYGEFPEWLSKQILLDHNVGSQDTFSLSDMVQWAFDHDYLDESEIAYNYASAATEIANAAAFLQSNNQAKHVRDCAIMVRHYKRYELRQMSMSAWIKKCCLECNEGNWRVIAQLLKFQGINFVEFLIAFKPFLKGLPKKNCLVFWGPPDSGKSLFCFSLLKFMRGKVISYMNSKSHFWLMPLSDCKIGLLDDATYPCWQYMDIHLRNAMDGNAISIDLKHKAPVQLSLPPLLVSTNVDVLKDQSLKYLHSRIKCFNFPNVLPVTENNESVYNITNETWACFFRKFATHLEISEDDGGDTGNINTAFQCTRRSDIEHY